MDWAALSKAIDEYEKENPTMDIYSPLGSQIIYTGIGGTEFDKEEADQFLNVGQTYTLGLKDIGGWRTEIALVEHPGYWFNSVMFRNAGKS